MRPGASILRADWQPTVVLFTAAVVNIRAGVDQPDACDDRRLFSGHAHRRRTPMVTELRALTRRPAFHTFSL
jgi:hypothetical protein